MPHRQDTEVGEPLRQKFQRELIYEVLRKNYGSIQLSDVTRRYNVLASYREDIPFDELQKLLPADAYLFVTVTEWKGEDFYDSSVVKAGAQAVLVMPNQAEPVWQDDFSNIEFEIAQGLGGYARARQVLFKRIASRLLRKLPEKPELAEIEPEKSEPETAQPVVESGSEAIVLEAKEISLKESENSE